MEGFRYIVVDGKITEYALEVNCGNVTPAEFAEEIKKACERNEIPYEFDLEEFSNPTTCCDMRYHIKDGVKTWKIDGVKYKENVNERDASCKAETVKTKPYEYETFIDGWDGSRYNEVGEFKFEDKTETRGRGYYYRMERK